MGAERLSDEELLESISNGMDQDEQAKDENR